MLINTKHIVMFDDAAEDFSRISQMVDDDGAVLILKDGRPAYALVSFDDVQESEAAPQAKSFKGGTAKADKAKGDNTKPAPQSGGPKVEPVAPPEEPTCACGRHAQSECGCGGHGHGGKGHGHGAGHSHGGGHAHGSGHAGGHAHADWMGGGYFGHGADAGHFHPGSEWDDSGENPEGEWGFDFHTGPGFDPLFQGGSDFSIDDFIGKIPPEVLDAGQQFLGRIGKLADLFNAPNQPKKPE